MACRLNFVLSLFLVIIVFVASSCTISNFFPAVVMGEKIDLVATQSTQERKCSVEGSKHAEEFVNFLSKKYPDNWSGLGLVSLAPSYEIVSGPTKILILERSIVILTTSSHGKKRIVHDLKPGEAKEIVVFLCGPQFFE